MSISRVTSWAAGNVLTASALNGEFDNILNNALLLISPLTGNLDFNGKLLQNLASGTVGAPALSFNADSDTGIYRQGANVLGLAAGGTDVMRLNTVASGVNYWSVTPSATGNPVLLTAAGSDTNVGLTINTQATGALRLLSAGTGAITIEPNSVVAFTATPAGATTVTGATTAALTATSGAATITASTNVVFVSGATTMMTVNGTTSVTLGTNKPLVPGAISGTPIANALYQDNIIKGWIVLDGTGVIASIDSFNVTSITDEGTGDVTVTWNTDFASATAWCTVATAKVNTTAADTTSDSVTAQPTGVSSSRYHTFRTNSAAPEDCALVHIIAIGDQ